MGKWLYRDNNPGNNGLFLPLDNFLKEIDFPDYAGHGLDIANQCHYSHF